MNIFHCIDLDNVGGVETLFEKFITLKFDGLDCKHYVIVNNKIHPRFKTVVNNHSQKVMSIKYWGGLKIPKKPSSLRTLRLERFFGQTTVDVIIAWNQFPFTQLPFFPKKSRTIYYEHGNSSYDHNRDKVNDLMHHFDHLVAVSRASLSVFEYKFESGTLSKSIIYNFLQPQYLEQEPSIAAPGNRISLLMAARLVPLKGYPIAIKALAILDKRGVDATLTIAGDGPERKYLYSMAAQEEIADKVHFLGTVTTLIPIYQRSDFLLVPSLREAASLVIAESLACGTPSIAANTGGIPEVSDNGKHSWLVEPTLNLEKYKEWCGSDYALPKQSFDPVSSCMIATQALNPETLADAIEQAASNSKKYHSKAEAGSNYARKHYSIEKYCQDFSKVLSGKL